MPGPLPRPIAFAFSGGAAFGAVQAGTLRALVAAGIRPDLVVGSSVGAINATSFAGDPTPAGADRLVGIWSDVPTRTIFPFGPSSLVRAARRTGHLIDSANLRRWLGRRITIDRIEDAPLPLHIVATDVEAQVPVVLSEGHALTAVMASTAIPGVFPAVAIGGRRLADGGTYADHPIVPALDLGARTVFAISAYGDPPVGPLPWRGRVLDALDRRFGREPHPDNAVDAWRRRPPSPERGEPVVHVLAAPATHGLNPFSFAQSARLMAEAEARTARWLAEHLPHLAAAG
jgi:NTE family protein